MFSAPGGGIATASFGWSEWLSGLCARLLHSVVFTIVYAVMVALNVGVMVWALAVVCPPPLFHFLDTLVTVFLAFEVLVRLLAVGSHLFFKRTSNLFDVAVLVFCVSLLLFFENCDLNSHLERAGDAVVRGLRNLLQCLRLALIIRKYRHLLFLSWLPGFLSF